MTRKKLIVVNRHWFNRGNLKGNKGEERTYKGNQERGEKALPAVDKRTRKLGIKRKCFGLS